MWMAAICPGPTETDDPAETPGCCDWVATALRENDSGARGVKVFLTGFTKSPLFVNGFAKVRSNGRRHRPQIWR
jgi:hypothetical protein